MHLSRNFAGLRSPGLPRYYHEEPKVHRVYGSSGGDFSAHRLRRPGERETNITRGKTTALYTVLLAVMVLTTVVVQSLDASKLLFVRYNPLVPLAVLQQHQNYERITFLSLQRLIAYVPTYQ